MPSAKAVTCARVALQVWDRDTAINMVAIAGAESSWNPNTGGDSPNLLQNLGYTESALQAASFNCPRNWYGHASWGYWQIFMPVHKGLLEQLGAPVAAGACAVSDWLKVPANNAAAAAQILRYSGYGAWTVFKTAAWLQYLDEARAAVHAVIGGEDVKPPGTDPIGPPGTQPAPVAAAISPFLLLLGLGAAGLFKWLKK